MTQEDQVASDGDPKDLKPGTATFEAIDRPEGLSNPRLGWNSDAIAELLRRLDLKYMALVPGASYRGFHDSVVNYLGNTNPQMLVCLHEEHTVAIAHGYAKVTDEPMAVAVHTNVGLMHAAMAVFNAWCDRKPVVIIGANGPLDADRRRPWIDWIHSTADQAHIIRDYTKWDDTPHSVAAAFESLLRANQVARTVPFGPTYVCLDEKLQEGALDGEIAFPDPARFAPGKPSAPTPDDVTAMADLLIAAEHPLIMAGRASRSREAWDKRVRLAEALGAVVLTDLHNSAAFPTDHPLHVLEARFHPRDQHLDAFARADAILSLDWLDLGGYVKRLGGVGNIDARVIHASLDSHLHRGWSMDYHILPPADLRVLAHPDQVVAALLTELEARGAATPKAQKLSLRDENPDRLEAVAEGAMALRDMALIWRTFHETREDISLINMPLGWPGRRWRGARPCGRRGAGIEGHRAPAGGHGGGRRFRDGGERDLDRLAHGHSAAGDRRQQPGVLQRRRTPGTGRHRPRTPGRKQMDRPAHRSAGCRHPRPRPLFRLRRGLGRRRIGVGARARKSGRRRQSRRPRGSRCPGRPRLRGVEIVFGSA
jgi:thiamine pyrophosphate-dependent acetolactate synthase large subunit-like protein